MHRSPLRGAGRGYSWGLCVPHRRTALSTALPWTLFRRMTYQAPDATDTAPLAQQIEDPQAAAALWMGGIDFIQGNLVQRAEHALDFDFKNATL